MEYLRRGKSVGRISNQSDAERRFAVQMRLKKAHKLLLS